MQLITVEPWVSCWCIYDVTDESCVNNIRNWIRYIEQHDSDNVHKILVGNKADMDESKRVEHRYRQYHTQMHLVISWFEQSTGVGFVKLYTRHSLASSDHFQENSGVSSKSLATKVPRQLGMIQHNAWRRQRGFPEYSVSILHAWLFDHFLHPYPKDSDKHMLAKQTSLSRSQVSN
ncbi:hypothetical protein ACET3Z_026754 [Daucus carota]